MTYVILYVLEKLCLFGNVLSGIIAFNIWRIPEKSLINKMFLVYFAIDCVIGASDPFFLFKLFRERAVVPCVHFKLAKLHLVNVLDL